jgi:DNA-directed RNA polymerase subunit alpha
LLDIIKPKVGYRADEKNEARGVITIGPLERGYATTLGNSLRRVLLSSLPGAAVTSIRIEDVLHEYSTIPKVKEDVTEIVLNIKGLVLTMDGDGDEDVRASISVSGKKEITGADIKFEGAAEVVNKNHHIASLEEGGKLNIDMRVSKGWGYVSAEDNKFDGMSISEIAVDAIYTPVRLANFTTERTRVGNRTDFDKLNLEIETDGSLTPLGAISIASKILSDHLDLLIDLDEAGKDLETLQEKGGPYGPSTRMSIASLKINQKIINALQREGFRTIGDILEKSKDELEAIPRIGRKSHDEIVKHLEDLGYQFASNDFDDDEDGNEGI